MSAISTKGLSKSYMLENGKGTFEALKDVSIQILPGESVGIIGPNGAGKSTLLKILSGITYPTTGDGKVEGTFSSLLEVGTGFHPDLSGRDNVYFNASLLGLSRKEIDTQFNGIVEFSGVSEFIDQPIRAYSSGMKLRLAFSILAHVKTDIIALDEVLAVGDSMFQVKCMERIFDFKKQGRTILFVSHNLGAVKKLCERTLVLQNGSLVFDGPTDEAVEFYLSSMKQTIETDEILEQIETHVSGNEVKIELRFSNLDSDGPIDLGLNLTTVDGNPIYHFSNRFINQELNPVDGNLKVELQFAHQLKPGNYPVAVYLGQAERQLLWKENADTLVIPPGTPYGFHNPDAIQGPVITEFGIKKV